MPWFHIWKGPLVGEGRRIKFRPTLNNLSGAKDFPDAKGEGRVVTKRSARFLSMGPLKCTQHIVCATWGHCVSFQPTKGALEAFSITLQKAPLMIRIEPVTPGARDIVVRSRTYSSTCPFSETTSLCLGLELSTPEETVDVGEDWSRHLVHKSIHVTFWGTLAGCLIWQFIDNSILCPK